MLCGKFLFHFLFGFLDFVRYHLLLASNWSPVAGWSLWLVDVSSTGWN